VDAELCRTPSNCEWRQQCKTSGTLPPYFKRFFSAFLEVSGQKVRDSSCSSKPMNYAFFPCTADKPAIRAHTLRLQCVAIFEIGPACLRGGPQCCSGEYALGNQFLSRLRVNANVAVTMSSASWPGAGRLGIIRRTNIRAMVRVNRPGKWQLIGPSLCEKRNSHWSCSPCGNTAPGSSFNPWKAWLHEAPSNRGAGHARQFPTPKSPVGTCLVIRKMACGFSLTTFKEKILCS